ncbi:MAG: hypothetical protein NXH86_10085 [Flavobacteriaceae bacterium]|uniref:hypothetical protein n=1 Tax=Flagellimonas sp. SN16 TaxID=3415142 RepID=UPI003C4F0209|nr:hypothetical protein [Flavobacteriaceae bacterium]
MKNIASLLFVVFFGNLVVAQSTKYTEDHQLTLNFLLPGVVYEYGVSNNSSLAAEATIGFAYRESTFFDSGIGIYPIGRIQYRYYYNFDRRLNKEKRIEGNTGNYIAPTFAIQGGKAVIGDLDYVSDFFGGVGVVYGLQRTGQKGLQFRFEVGPALFFDEFDTGPGMLMALKLGWVIPKR